MLGRISTTQGVMSGSVVRALKPASSCSSSASKLTLELGFASVGEISLESNDLAQEGFIESGNNDARLDTGDNVSNGDNRDRSDIG